VSEDCCFIMLNEQYFRYIKIHFNEMIMMSALYKTSNLHWILTMLAQWNQSSQIDMSLHLDKLSWLSQSVFAVTSNCYMLRVLAVNFHYSLPYRIWNGNWNLLYANHYATEEVNLNEWASDCCLTPIELFFQLVFDDMMMKPGCAWLICWAGFLEYYFTCRHFTSLRHTMWTQSQQVLALTLTQ